MIAWAEAPDPGHPPQLARPSGAERQPGALVDWAASHRADLRDRVLRHGAVLFRGFEFQQPREFEALARTITDSLMRYAGGASPRTNVHGDVYTSTEFSRHHAIAQHCEASYLPGMPRMIHFFCARPAERGGATPLSDTRRVLAKLDPRIVGVFREKGVRYLNTLNAGVGFGRSWQAQFETDEREKVEARLRADGYDWQWLPDGRLRTAITQPCIRTHPDTGESAWVGQPDHWHPTGLDPSVRERMAKLLPESEFPLNATFSDGSPIDEADLEHIREAVRSETVAFDWEAGDVLVCDNFLVAHGRQPYSGDRKVYVALG